MEFLRAGEALLRSSQPLLPFLAPSVIRFPKTTRLGTGTLSHHRASQRAQDQAPRAFSTTVCQRNPSTPETDVSTAATKSTQHPPSAPASKSTVDGDIASLLDDTLDFGKGTTTAPTSRTSRFASTRAQSSRRPDSMPSGNSLEDLLSSMSSPARARPSRKSNTLDIASMLDPLGNTRSRAQSGPPSTVEERPVLKLGSSTGRTVTVKKELPDVGRAFRSLEALCARNSVRKDFQRQRFHERPGLKRKRLKSERWRKNFKTQFKETIAMVQKMRKQGW